MEMLRVWIGTLSVIYQPAFVRDDFTVCKNKIKKLLETAEFVTSATYHDVLDHHPARGSDSNTLQQHHTKWNFEAVKT